MDKAAVGFDYKSQAEKHDSQKGELGEPSAAGCVGTGAGTLPAGAEGTVVEFCSLLHGWWGSYGEGAAECHCWQHGSGSGAESRRMMRECWKKPRLMKGSSRFRWALGSPE